MSRTAEMKKLVDAFEKERDKLLDQVQFIKGHAERMEWVIKVMNSHISTVEKEEEQKAIQAAAYEDAIKVAREKGNVGVHPSERPSLAERKNLPQIISSDLEDSNKKKKKVD